MLGVFYMQNPVNPYTSQISSAMNQGQQNQAALNNQVTQLQGQQGQSYNQANSAYGNLTNYANTLPQNYMSDMSQIGGMMGYNPSTTQHAAQGLTSAENIMNALPGAVNQMGNYSGATAGQVAQNYGNMAGNISGQVTNANNALQNQLGMFGQMQTGAQNITGQQEAAYGTAYSTAVNQYQQASSVMSNIENLQQQQGYVTAHQVQAYNAAYASQQAAQQSAATAYAQAQSGAQTQQQVGYMSNIQQAMQSLYGNNWQVALAELSKGANPNVPTASPNITTSTGTPAPSMALGGAAGSPLGLSALGG